MHVLYNVKTYIFREGNEHKYNFKKPNGLNTTNEIVEIPQQLFIHSNMVSVYSREIALNKSFGYV